MRERPPKHTGGQVSNAVLLKAILAAAAMLITSTHQTALRRHKLRHMSCTCKLSEPCMFLSDDPYEKGQAGKHAMRFKILSISKDLSCVIS